MALLYAVGPHFPISLNLKFAGPLLGSSGKFMLMLWLPTFARLCAPEAQRTLEAIPKSREPALRVEFGWMRGGSERLDPM